VKDITALIQATVLTTGGPMVDLMVDPIMGAIRDQLRSLLATGHIMFVAPDIGQVERITFGGQDIGGIDTARESGSTAITSCEDTEPRECSIAATSAGYQAVANPPSRPRKAPTSVSRRSWRFR